MRETLKIIEAEHRSIESVLRGLCFYVDQTLAGKPVPEAQVFRAMLQYLDLFAERLHHPKEDQFLFARLRNRTHEADAVLGRLEQDHHHGAQQIRELEQAFLRYEEGGEPFFLAFAQEVYAYTIFYLNHLRTEEKMLLPICERALTEQDWREIDAAFATHQDPLASMQTERDISELFARVVAIMPVQPVPDKRNAASG